MEKSVIGLLVRTFPYVLLRLVIMIGMIVPIYYSIKAGINLGRSLLGREIFIFDLAYGYVGFIAFILYIDFARKISFHFVKHAQIACVTDMLAGNEIKGNILFHGFRKTRERFISVSSMYIVDSLVSKSVNSISSWIGEKLHPYLTKDGKPRGFVIGFISKLVGKVIKTIANHVDEAIMSYLFVNKDIGFWKGSAKAIWLYLLYWKELFKETFFSLLWAALLSTILRITVLGLSIWFLIGNNILQVFIVYGLYRLLELVVRMTLIEPYYSITTLVGFYKRTNDVDVEGEDVTQLEDILEDLGSTSILGSRKVSTDGLVEVIKGKIGDVPQSKELSKILNMFDIFKNLKGGVKSEDGGIPK